jgi:hypothetical protein
LEIGGEKRITVKFTIVDYRVDYSREGNDPRTGVVNQRYVHPTADRRGIHKHGLAEESGRNGLNDSTRNGRQGQALVEPITHFCMESLTLQLVLPVPNCRGGLGFYFLPQRDQRPCVVFWSEEELVRTTPVGQKATKVGKKLGDWITV